MRVYVGDTAPDLAGRLLLPDQPLNLTGASVEVHVRFADGTTVSRAATVTDAAGGEWAMAWTPADLTAPRIGTASVEVQVTYANGKIETFGAARISVRAAIA